MSSRLWPAGSDEGLPELAPHQELAVDWIRHRLARYTGVLLADEVGLGKSWVAATIARDRARSGENVELIVPASLVPMWRDVRDQFGFDAAIHTHDRVRRSPPPSGTPAFIVVDEAHRFRNPKTKGWERLAGRMVGARGLFLTATPIWNRPADLLALLRLLVGDDVLKCSGVASIDSGLAGPIGRARILDQLVLRRTQKALATGDLGDVTSRRIRYGVPPSWTELERRIDHLAFPHCLGFSRSILSLLMIRRLHSSPEALRGSLERQLRFCRSGLDLLRDGYRLNRRDFTRFLIVDEGVQELLFPELFLESEDEPDAAELSGEIATIESILDQIRTLPDHKKQCLIELIASDHRPSLVFTGAVETVRTLWDAIAPLIRCGAATGSWCRSPSGHGSVGEIAREFQEGRLDLLITTDLGGEGLNLQRADRVVHYDLPWSPMRLEQRNGRARRLGRNGRPIEVLTFLPEGEPFPLWSTLVKKRDAERSFWQIGLSRETSHPSLVRLPSKIASTDPQTRLWRALPWSPDRSLLLHRYPAGVESALSEIDSADGLKILTTRNRQND